MTGWLVRRRRWRAKYEGTEKANDALAAHNARMEQQAAALATRLDSATGQVSALQERVVALVHAQNEWLGQQAQLDTGTA